MENLRHLHLPFFDANECKEIISYIDKKQIFFEKKYDQRFKEKNSVYENLSTLFHKKYNFFNDNPKYIPRLETILIENFPHLKYPLFVQCWANFYKKNQGISWHRHSFIDGVDTPGLTSNIFIGGDESIGITYAIHDKNIPKYNYTNIKNKIGHIQFTSNKTYHMVSPNKSDQKRYTLGMTITEYDHRYSEHFVYSLTKKIDKQELLIITKPDVIKPSFNYA